MKDVIVKQDGMKECAMSCLLSIIRYYKGNMSKEEISYLIKEDNNGVNVYNLINGAKKIGFDGYAIKENFDDLINTPKHFPLIVHTKINNVYHFMVIYKINTNKEYLLVMDPGKGMIKYKFYDFKKIYNEVLIILYPIKKLPLLKENNELVSLIFNVIKSINYFKLLIYSLLIIIFTIINSFYFKIVIDYLIKYKNIRYLIIVSLIFIIISLLKNIIDFIKDNILLSINYKVSSTINNYTIGHILKLPYHYFKTKPTGDIINRINDLEEVKELISKVLINILLNILLIIISSIVLIFINYKLFFISIIFTIMYLIISIIYYYIFKEKIEQVKESYSSYESLLIESLENYESIKNLNIINKIIRKIEIVYYIYLNKYNSFLNKYIRGELLKNLIDDFYIIITLSIGSYMVFNNIITLGTLITFVSLLSFYFNPIKSLIDYLPNIRLAKSSFNRINELLKYKEEEYITCDNLLNGSIKVCNLSYSYNNINYIIKNKSFIIKNNTFTLITASSGSGKSTFIKILKKYIKDYEGAIFINDINLKDIDKNILDNNINYISQNERLFTGTIKENILITNNIDETKYINILKLCKVDNVIDSKINRNDFLIEENGFNLSGGERQRIILARALVKKFNYLVLDEALSEVDIDLKIEILNNLKKYYKNKTIIVISHDTKINSLFKNVINF